MCFRVSLLSFFFPPLTIASPYTFSKKCSQSSVPTKLGPPPARPKKRGKLAFGNETIWRLRFENSSSFPPGLHGNRPSSPYVLRRVFPFPLSCSIVFFTRMTNTVFIAIPHLLRTRKSLILKFCWFSFLRPFMVEDVSFRGAEIEQRFAMAAFSLSHFNSRSASPSFALLTPLAKVSFLKASDETRRGWFLFLLFGLCKVTVELFDISLSPQHLPSGIFLVRFRQLFPCRNATDVRIEGDILASASAYLF